MEIRGVVSGRMRSRRATVARLIDAALVVAVFVGASAMARAYLGTIRVKHTVEWELAPAVMMACGAGFNRPAAEPPALTEFLLRARDSISCDVVEGQTPLAPVPVAHGERYAIYALGAVLRFTGLSWRALDGYMAALFGLSMALAYGIFRLLAGPVLALLGVVGVAWSNQLPNLASFRDYGKQPAFFALWLILGWMVWRGRARVAGELLLLAAAAGAATGIGIGFRVDVVVFVPAFLGVIVFAVAGWDRRALAVKACAAAIFLATFGLAGRPILSSMSRGSNSAHVVLLGLMGSFNRTLGLQPALYDIGDMYSDTFVYVLTSSYASLSEHIPGPLGIGSHAYDRVGTRLLTDLARRFPADGLIRGLGATAQAIRYPFDGSARLAYDGKPPFDASPHLATIGEWRARALGLAEGHAVLLAVAALLLAAFRDWRLGLTGALLTLYFCGYSMLQYSRRHTFHLDLIAIGLLLLALDAIVTMVRALTKYHVSRTAHEQMEPRSIARAAASGAVALGGLVVILATLLGGARWWQQRHVTQLIEQTLAVAWEDVQPAPEPLAATTVRDGVPIATWTRVFATDPDRWKTAVLLRVARPSSPDSWLQVEYFQLQIGGGACRAASVPVAVKYTGVEQTDNYEYTRLFDVAVAPGGGTSRLLTPGFYEGGPTWTRFDGFAVPADVSACITRVQRAHAAGDVPLPLLNAVLPPTWRDEPLYQRLRVPPAFTSAGTPTYAFTVSPRI